MSTSPEENLTEAQNELYQWIKNYFRDFQREFMQFSQHSKTYNRHNSCLIVIWENKKQEWQLWFGT